MADGAALPRRHSRTFNPAAAKPRRRKGSLREPAGRARRRALNSAAISLRRAATIYDNFVMD
jgi:hypothetical protein